MQAKPHLNHSQVTAELLARWPEHRVAPSLSRIQALCELLGDAQRAAPVIQITGTNGKGSTAILIDALLRELGLRTGRFTSPHLVDVTERICIDGAPISAERFDEVYEDIKPLIELVDAKRLDGVAMTFFEVMTGLGYAAFADAPVDVAVVEVGMGGTWDATSVADATVGVICPIGMDHMQYLGDTLAQIATEKAGIIKTGTTAVSARQAPEALAVLKARCAAQRATLFAEPEQLGVDRRVLAAGGQVIDFHTQTGAQQGVFLPLHGAHMAENATVAVAAVEAFLGRPLDPTIVANAFDQVQAPTRLEVVASDPTVLLDTAHNPAAFSATLDAVREAFALDPLIGVVAMMRDKQVEACLGALEPMLDQVVVTQIAGSDRCLPTAELQQIATDVFGTERVSAVDDAAGATRKAMGLATQSGAGAGVLVIGSVYLAGEIRAWLKPADPNQM